MSITLKDLESLLKQIKDNPSHALKKIKQLPLRIRQDYLMVKTTDGKYPFFTELAKQIQNQKDSSCRYLLSEMIPLFTHSLLPTQLLDHEDMILILSVLITQGYEDKISLLLSKLSLESIHKILYAELPLLPEKQTYNEYLLSRIPNKNIMDQIFILLEALSAMSNVNSPNLWFFVQLVNHEKTIDFRAQFLIMMGKHLNYYLQGPRTYLYRLYINLNSYDYINKTLDPVYVVDRNREMYRTFVQTDFHPIFFMTALGKLRAPEYLSFMHDSELQNHLSDLYRSHGTPLQEAIHYYYSNRSSVFNPSLADSFITRLTAAASFHNEFYQNYSYQPLWNAMEILERAFAYPVLNQFFLKLSKDLRDEYLISLTQERWERLTLAPNNEFLPSLVQHLGEDLIVRMKASPFSALHGIPAYAKFLEAIYIKAPGFFMNHPVHGAALARLPSLNESELKSSMDVPLTQEHGRVHARRLFGFSRHPDAFVELLHSDTALAIRYYQIFHKTTVAKMVKADRNLSNQLFKHFQSLDFFWLNLHEALPFLPGEANHYPYHSVFNEAGRIGYFILMGEEQPRAPLSQQQRDQGLSLYPQEVAQQYLNYKNRSNMTRFFSSDASSEQVFHRYAYLHDKLMPAYIHMLRDFMTQSDTPLKIENTEVESILKTIYWLKQIPLLNAIISRLPGPALLYLFKNSSIATQGQEPNPKSFIDLIHSGKNSHSQDLNSILFHLLSRLLTLEPENAAIIAGSHLHQFHPKYRQPSPPPRYTPPPPASAPAAQVDNIDHLKQIIETQRKTIESLTQQLENREKASSKPKAQFS